MIMKTKEVSIELCAYEDIKFFLRDPDFTKDDYGRAVIPSGRFMVTKVENHLQKQFPDVPSLEFKKILIKALFRLRAMFQVKYGAVIEVFPEEYESYGITEGAVKKYLLELDSAVKKLEKHYKDLNTELNQT